MGGIGCNCCCALNLADLPDISIAGMEAAGAWTPAGDCCFSRRYNYLVAQPKRVLSVDVQRSIYHQEATQVFIAKTYATLGCTGLFDCAQIDTVDDSKWVERLGLLYQLQYVEVFIQFKKITCPYTGEADRYIVSTRHAVKFRPTFISDVYADNTGVYTSLAACCSGIGSLDYSYTGSEPDWTDPTIWPGYSSSFTDGEYWNHKIYDAMPSGTSETIDGCIAPCTIEDLCAVECEGICVTSEPSEIVPTNGGFAICPTPAFVGRTCTYTYNNPFDGTTGCTSTATYYEVNPASLCPINIYYGFNAAFPGCGAGVARAIGYTTTAFSLTTSCTFNYGAEVCLQTPVSLLFPVTI